MTPSEFEEQNFVFTKPEDMSDEQCCSLPVYRGPHEEGYPTINSCWKLSEEEIERVKETGEIWMTVVGQGTPPISLSTQKPNHVKKNNQDGNPQG